MSDEPDKDISPLRLKRPGATPPLPPSDEGVAPPILFLPDEPVSPPASNPEVVGGIGEASPDVVLTRRRPKLVLPGKAVTTESVVTPPPEEPEPAPIKLRLGLKAQSPAVDAASAAVAAAAKVAEVVMAESLLVYEPVPEPSPAADRDAAAPDADVVVVEPRPLGEAEPALPKEAEPEGLPPILTSAVAAPLPVMKGWTKFKSGSTPGSIEARRLKRLAVGLVVLLVAGVVLLGAGVYFIFVSLHDSKAPAPKPVPAKLARPPESSGVGKVPAVDATPGTTATAGGVAPPAVPGTKTSVPAVVPEPGAAEGPEIVPRLVPEPAVGSNRAPANNANNSPPLPAPSARFVSFVNKDLKVGAVYQGPPPRVIMNGRLVRIDDDVDSVLGIRFVGADLKARELILQDYTGAQIRVNY